MTTAVENNGLIDQGAPRTNQAVVAIVVLLAFALDQAWWLPVLTGILYFGVLFGRRYVLPYHLYFRVIQPRLGKVWMEDERAPRFAQAMGATGLLIGFLCIQADAVAIGWGLVLLLAAAALMSTFSGICLGCLTYRMIAKFRGTKPMRPKVIDLQDLSPTQIKDSMLIEFGHPLCDDCQRWEKRLQDEGQAFITVDVREHPDLARKYGVTLLPTILEIDNAGQVLRQLAP